MLWHWQTRSLFCQCKKERQVTLLCAFMHLPQDQSVITGLSEHQWVALGDRAVTARLREPNFWPGWSSSLHLKTVEDQIHQFFLCQVPGNLTKHLSKLQVSRLQASLSSDGTRRGPQQIILHYLRCMPVFSSCLGPRVTHEETPLCFGHVLKEGVQDLWERQQRGEVAEVLHGVVGPALAIPEDLPWTTASWPIMLLWWSTPGLRGRIWTGLPSDKEWGLADGKHMSHWLVSPRFPALHKPVASQFLTQFLLVHKQLY